MARVEELSPMAEHTPLMGAERSFTLSVEPPSAGLRLDLFLVASDLPLSRSQIKRVIDEGRCFVNGSIARAGQRLRLGDAVLFELPEPEPSELEAEAIPLSVLYEDEHLVVVDKPAGMVVHPAPGHSRGTLVAALLAHCTNLSGIGGVLRPGIVHRLDKLTSGVMVATKTDLAHGALAAQFEVHSIERRYIALVAGAIGGECGVFDTLHGRHPVDRKRYTTRVERGRRAITHYRVLERFPDATLVEARLETGRTHQVRVHFAEGGHPLLGDCVYGRAGKKPLLREISATLGRQALHARLLAFDHPTRGERMSFSSPLALDIQAAVARLRGARDEPISGRHR